MDLEYPQLPGSSPILLLYVALAVSLLGPQRAAAQNPPGPTAVASCEEACGITLDLEMEYGDDSGPGILDLVGWVKALSRCLGADIHRRRPDRQRAGVRPRRTFRATDRQQWLRPR